MILEFFIKAFQDILSFEYLLVIISLKNHKHNRFPVKTIVEPEPSFPPRKYTCTCITIDNNLLYLDF